MRESIQGRIGGSIKWLRRLAPTAALSMLLVLAMAPVGLADNGRDASFRPGPATDSVSLPAPDFDGNGRSAADRALQSASPQVQVQTTAVVSTGRGGVDPTVGPNPIPTAAIERAVDPPKFDTDSGKKAPAKGGKGKPAEQEPQALADQDVPGAATMEAPGLDLPPNDQDG